MTQYQRLRDAEQIADALKTLGDPVRARIVDLIWRPEKECCSPDDRVCACDLEKALGLSQPTVSHHMKILTSSGLIMSAKDGRWVYYTVNRYAFADLGSFVSKYAENQPGSTDRAPNAELVS